MLYDPNADNNLRCKLQVSLPSTSDRIGLPQNPECINIRSAKLMSVCNASRLITVLHQKTEDFWSNFRNVRQKIRPLFPFLDTFINDPLVADNLSTALIYSFTLLNSECAFITSPKNSVNTRRQTQAFAPMCKGIQLSDQRIVYASLKLYENCWLFQDNETKKMYIAIDRKGEAGTDTLDYRLMFIEGIAVFPVSIVEPGIQITIDEVYGYIHDDITGWNDGIAGGLPVNTCTLRIDGINSNQQQSGNDWLNYTSLFVCDERWNDLALSPSPSGGFVTSFNDGKYLYVNGKLYPVENVRQVDKNNNVTVNPNHYRMRYYATLEELNDPASTSIIEKIKTFLTPAKNAYNNYKSITDSKRLQQVTNTNQFSEMSTGDSWESATINANMVSEMAKAIFGQVFQGGKTKKPKPKPKPKAKR